MGNGIIGMDLWCFGVFLSRALLVPGFSHLFFAVWFGGSCYVCTFPRIWGRLFVSFSFAHSFDEVVDGAEWWI
jgi:hypothetical protein